MITNMLTLTDYLLQEEGSETGTAGSLTHLLSTIEDASQLIADQVRVLGLAHLTGKTGGVNTFGEEVQKLDLFANQLLVDMLLTSGVVYAVVSEELEQPEHDEWAEPSGDAPSPEPAERASWSGGGPAVPAQEEQTRPLSWPQQDQTRPLRRPPQEDPPTARFGLHP